MFTICAALASTLMNPMSAGAHLIFWETGFVKDAAVSIAERYPRVRTALRAASIACLAASHKIVKPHD
jgi:hypothetical protein